MSSGAAQERLDLSQVKETSLLSSLEHAIERRGMSARRLIEKRSGETRERDAFAKRPIISSERGEMEAEGPTLSTRCRDGHVDGSGPIPQQPPEPGSGRVTSDGARARGEHRGHASSLPGEAEAPDCVDASVNPAQATSARGVGDRVARIAELSQLSRRDDAVLRLRQPGERLVRLTFVGNNPTKVKSVRARPRRALRRCGSASC